MVCFCAEVKTKLAECMMNGTEAQKVEVGEFFQQIDRMINIASDMHIAIDVVVNEGK